MEHDVIYFKKLFVCAIVEQVESDSGSPAYCQFAVSHLLQTHSLNNDPTDRKTQVWGCEFEPDPERKGNKCNFSPSGTVCGK